MVCVEARERLKMKGVKDEEKHFDPLFPRISISEAERGGPKAPPRNKMALCEQLTIPASHRFNNGAMPILPLPPPSTSTSLTAPSPPSHVDCHKNGLFSPFSSRNGHDGSSRYHDLGVRHHPHSSNGVTSSTLMAPKFRSLVPMSYQSAVHWPPSSKHSMLQPRCFLNSRNSSAEKNKEHVNNARISSFSQLGWSARNGHAMDNMEKHDHTFSCTSSSGKVQTAAEKKLSLTSLGDLKVVKEEGRSSSSLISEKDMEKSASAQLSNDDVSRVVAKSSGPDTSVLMLEYPQKHVKVNSEVPDTLENHSKRPPYILSTRLKTLPDAGSGLSTKGRNTEPDESEDILIGSKVYSLSDDEKRFNKPFIQVHRNYSSWLEHKASRGCVPASSETSIRKRSASVMEGPSRSMEELGFKHKSSTKLTSMDECFKVKYCGSESGEINDESDSISDTSVGKSISSFLASPEDVVRAIGQETFWKTRRTILHQQRILAAQLFDLHRLVKVQSLMAESPEMLYEDNLYSRKSSIKLLHSRKLFAETNKDIKANLQESNFKIEHIPESTNRKPPPLSTDKVLYTRQPPPIPCLRELVVPPITTDTKSSPLIFHPPPGNQWLVPVRSPSEGLVYKPYSGPLRPTAGILSPVYDNFAPITLTGMADLSFLNTPYSLPASNLQGLGNLSGHSPLGQPYLQPLSIPAINTSGSTSTFGPTRKFIEHPVADQDSTMPFSICSIQTHRNGIVSECSKHLEVCKSNNLQDSTETSPPEKNKVDILSLFPTTPSHHPPLSSSPPEQKIQVIKVVPHNRKSASESAARIFQTIQEERKQHG